MKNNIINFRKKLLSMCFVLALILCIFDIPSIARQKTDNTDNAEISENLKIESNNRKSENHIIVSKNINTGEVEYNNYEGTTDQVLSSSPDNFATLLEGNTDKSIRSVINNKWYRVTNTTQNPYNKVCQIISHFSNGVTQYGSGFVAGPNLVVTAGHVVYDHENGGWCSWMEIIPAKNGPGSAPYGVYYATMMHTNSQWINNAEHDYDWAYIDTNNPIGNTVGWFGLSTGATVNESINLTGYPGGKNEQMWNSPGTIKTVSTTRLSYDCDMVGGSSGSPVYDNGGYVRGINAYEYPNTTIPNFGPRITNSLFQDLVSAKVQYNLSGPGYLDEATSSIIRGWAINPDDRYARVEVHIYFYNADTGEYVIGIPGVMAQNFRSDVGYHAYQYNTPNLPSGRYKVVVYAIYGNNPMLIGSGKIFSK